jgi:hypothetical protein
MTIRNFMLLPMPPANAEVGIISAKIVDANINRSSISIINVSSNPVYLSFGNSPAVVGAGIVVFPNGGTFLMDNSTATIECINAVSSDVASVAIQEFN